jgi:hypothetical protein
MYSLLMLIIIGGIALLLLTERSRKLSLVKKHQLIYVTGASERYPNLPLGDFGIPLRLKDPYSNRVEVVFPRLTSEGDVEYIYSWHNLSSVEPPQYLTQRATPALDLTKRVEVLIREHLQIQEDLNRLQERYDDISRMVNLVSRSGFYGGHRDMYEERMDQIGDVLTKAEGIQQLYVYLIREALIGLQVGQHDARYFFDEHPDFDQQYNQAREDFFHMREAAIAYSKLMRGEKELEAEE